MCLVILISRGIEPEEQKKRDEEAEIQEFFEVRDPSFLAGVFSMTPRS